ncbi:MAG: OmpW family outer membrane protein [Chlamydiales bacterium]|nr:OmpW family outer membrane protein [Chlamydiales bacterium]
MSHYLHANVIHKACPLEKVVVAFRTSYFYPSSSTFRDMFQGGVNFQLTSTIPIYKRQNLWLKRATLWTGIDYFYKDGHSTFLSDKTHIQIIPLTLGLKYYLPSLCFKLPLTCYVAAGMRYYFVHTHNDSNVVQQVIDRSGVGAVVETGVMTAIYDHIILDLFVSYSFKYFRAPSIDNLAVEGVGLNVGGVNVGMGIGYEF